jgi:hypothetical protein
MKLKVINTEKLYGFCDKKGNTYINIELIYKHYPSTDKFIKKFSQVLLHEKLHDIIDDIVIGKVYHDTVITQENYTLGTEKVIRLLTNERWSKQEKVLYETKNNIKPRQNNSRRTKSKLRNSSS